MDLVVIPPDRRGFACHGQRETLPFHGRGRVGSLFCFSPDTVAAEIAPAEGRISIASFSNDTAVARITAARAPEASPGGNGGRKKEEEEVEGGSEGRAR